jgi:tetratricopeptide (TPR) repeat protein
MLLPEARWKREEKWYLRALLEVAIMKYEQKDIAGAVAIMDRGLEMEPQHKQLLAAKGMAFFSVQDLRSALFLFDRSLRVDPDYEMGWYGRGLVMEAQGNLSEAEAAYRRLLDSPPGTLDREEIRARLRAIAERR